MYDDLIIFLARQRAGTNAVRTVLETHEAISSVGEVFYHPETEFETDLIRRANFFTFVEERARGDVTKTFPNHQELLFHDYFEYLRCFSDKQYKLIDVKYNMTHFFAPRVTSIASGSFLEFITEHELKLFHLTRMNYLRVYLSALKAWNSGVYTVPLHDGQYRDTRLCVDAEALMEEFEIYEREDRVVAEQLADHPNVFVYEYAEAFPGNEPISPSFLASFAAWLGVPNRFHPAPGYRKQSSLSLRDTIENYDEIETLLRGTRFERCLGDEPIAIEQSTSLAPTLAEATRERAASHKTASAKKASRRGGRQSSVGRGK